MIKGKHIAITGILAFYKREDAFSQIRTRGGIPQDSVTRKNTIRGGKSNKRILAEKYIGQGIRIRIIKEEDFLSMLWSSPLLP